MVYLVVHGDVVRLFLSVFPSHLRGSVKFGALKALRWNAVLKVQGHLLDPVRRLLVRLLHQSDLIFYGELAVEYRARLVCFL